LLRKSIWIGIYDEYLESIIKNNITRKAAERIIRDMMDYIFVIGPSGVGKTTLAKGVFAHYGGAYVEQSMIPEFTIPDGILDEGVYEEEVCFESTIRQLEYFHERGIRNIIALDFDDVRARELPILFKGSRYIILRLITSDVSQLISQIEYRKEHEGGLYYPEYAQRSNSVISRRKLLPNEAIIDVAEKSRDEVLQEAINLIDHFIPKLEYEYVVDQEDIYLSWVKSKQLY